MIIQALPSAGKTWLVQQHPTVWVDGDDIVCEVTQLPKAYDAVAAIRESEELQKKLSDRLTEIVEDGLHIAANVNFKKLGVDWAAPDLVVRYDGPDYIKHLKIAKREDLLKFGEAELLRWTQPDQDITTVYLTPGTFLADLVKLMHL